MSSSQMARNSLCSQQLPIIKEEQNNDDKIPVLMSQVLDARQYDTIKKDEDTLNKKESALSLKSDNNNLKIKGNYYELNGSNEDDSDLITKSKLSVLMLIAVLCVIGIIFGIKMLSQMD